MLITAQAVLATEEKERLRDLAQGSICSSATHRRKRISNSGGDTFGTK